MKRFAIYAIAQAVAYTILVYNYRMIAAGNIPLALFTDGLYAALQFAIVRRIAKDESTTAGMAGYIVGSLIGTTLGMLI